MSLLGLHQRRARTLTRTAWQRTSSAHRRWVPREGRPRRPCNRPTSSSSCQTYISTRVAANGKLSLSSMSLKISIRKLQTKWNSSRRTAETQATRSASQWLSKRAPSKSSSTKKRYKTTTNNMMRVSFRRTPKCPRRHSTRVKSTSCSRPSRPRLPLPIGRELWRRRCKTKDNERKNFKKNYNNPRPKLTCPKINLSCSSCRRI